jgi:probable F420-dependent oxidoreductase
MSESVEFGRFGILRRSRELWPELAATLERLGYGALWVGGSPDGDLRHVEDLLNATSTVAVATGIVNIWKDGPELVAASYHRIQARHPGRFVLGIGVGHPETVGDRYRRPYETLAEYLDQLDAAGVPVHGRMLAALGPRFLRMAAARARGALPYLVTPEHTRRARAIMGDRVFLAPEQKVVLDSDPARGKEVARSAVQPYLRLGNYTKNLRSLGFTDEDLVGQGTDRLVDALVIQGDASAVARGLHTHLDDGADHVAINLLTRHEDEISAEFKSLAAALFS